MKINWKLSNPNAHIWFYLMIPLLLIATWYGGRSLGADPYWVDEVIASQRSGIAWYAPVSSVIDIWHRTAEISDQVPGYYMMLGLWSNVAGTTPFADRALSLFWGVLSVAVVFQIGRSLRSPLAGFGAALALASSAFFILFFHEMRTYALLMCLIALLMWSYWIVVYGKAAWWSQVLLVLSAAGMLYSYYLAIVIITTVCLYHLIAVPKNMSWWRIVILMGIAGVLFLPWVLTSISVFRDTERNWIRQAFSVNDVQGIVRLFSAFSNKNNVFFGFLLLFALRPREKAVHFAWFVMLVILLLMLILNPLVGIFVNLRYSLLLWIPIATLAGLGIDRIVRIGIPAAIVLGVIFANGAVSVLDARLTEEYDQPIRYLPWDSLTDITQKFEQAHDTLVFLALIEGDGWEGVQEERVMPHYFHGSLIKPVFIEDVRNLPDEAFLREGQQLTQDAQRVWLSYAPKVRSWRTGMFQNMLEENGLQLCGNFANNHTLYLDLYAHPRAIEAHETFRFGDDDSQTVAELTPIQSVPASVEDDHLTLIHAWTLSDALPRNVYSLAVHIDDADGNVAAQADYGLPAESFSCTLAHVPVHDLPAGSYQIRSFIYAWEDGTRLPILSTDDPAGDAITLGEFTIKR